MTEDVVAVRLREHLGAHVPPEAVPTRFVFVDRLPTLPNGKVDRGALGCLAVTGAGAPGQDQAWDGERLDNSELLARMFAAELSRADVGADENLAHLGVNSLVLVRVCAAWSEHTGRQVDGARVAASPTVRSIVDHSTEAAPARPVDGIEVRDHYLDVPLDHDNPEGPVIGVFAQTIRRPTGRGPDLPYLLYLQGGPGGRCHDPREQLQAWMDVALDHFQVVFLDQRGGGRSSALDAASIAGLSAPEAAERVRCYRADSIVRDAEVLRERVVRAPSWTLLGESYGGAIALTYLSFFPGRIDRVLLSNGLLGPVSDAESVLRETLSVSKRKNAEFYERYPEDAAAVDCIVRRLRIAEVQLPTGERLTPERFAMLGLMFGFERGMIALHELIGTAWAGDNLAEKFLGAVAAMTIYTASPLFYLQEYVYGGPGRATGWTAQRLYSNEPDFRPDAHPFCFYGEVFFPWMFEQLPMLRPFAEVANELARYAGWRPLYDMERLRRNTVPILAVAVTDDLYVPFAEQVRTARAVGSCWLIVLPDRDHAALMNNREAFANLLAFAAISKPAEGLTP